MPRVKRFRPSMRSPWTLLILTIVALLMYAWANSSRVVKKAEGYDEMLAASKWMQAAMDTLRNYQVPKGIFIDDVNDPNLSALIGQQFTAITTETGDLNAKWTALNPNMAGIFVEYFVRAGVEKGDHIAVGLSGSFPGMNLAMYAACRAMEIEPIVIASVGASSWGANDPYFAWIDMERVLNEKGMLASRSCAASIGGGEDIGRQLSPEGRELIREAVKRNNLQLIEEESLDASIEKRIAIYDSVANNSQIKLYVNIGGGLGSVGHSRNTNLIGEGFFEQIPMVNYPHRGTLHYMNAKSIPVLNVVNIVTLAREHELPRTPNPLPQPGSGSLFQVEHYNLLVTAIALLIVIATLVIVLIFDRRLQRLDRPGVDPDTLM